jgi:hypothetical protein
MSFDLARVAIALSMLFAITASAVAQSVRDLPRIENAILESRAKWIRGELKIQTDFSLLRVPERIESRTIMSLYFDGDKRRGDYYEVDATGNNRRSNLLCANCLEGSSHVRLKTDEEWGIDHFTELEIRRMKSDEANRYAVLDIRKVGLVPQRLDRLFNYSRSMIVGTPDKLQPGVQSAEQDGHELLKITYLRPNGVKISYNTVPAMDYAVTRVEGIANPKARMQGRSSRGPSIHVEVRGNRRW